MTVHSNTDDILVLTGQSIDSGNFGVPPVAEAPKQTAVVFGGKSAGFLTGTSGHVFFAIGPTKFDVYWDNPETGANSCDLHVTGPNLLDYAIHHACGGGNQDTPMTYEIYRQSAAFGPMLVNKHRGKVLDIPGLSRENALIQQYGANGGPNQRWIFTKLSGDGPNSVYTLTNQSGQKCMDIVDGDNQPQAQVQQYNRHSGPNQQWRFSRVEDTYFAIYNVNSGHCLDIPNSSNADDTSAVSLP